MKVNRLFILTLFLLAIFAIGAVSASDDVNATEEVVSAEGPDEGDLQVVEDDDVLASDIEISIDDEIPVDENNVYTFEVDNGDAIYLEGPEEASGTLTVKINQVLTNLRYDEDDECIYVNDSEATSNSLYLEAEEDEELDYEISLDKLTPNKIYDVVVKFGGVTESFRIKLIGEGGEIPEDENVTIDMENGTYVIGTDSIEITLPDEVTGTLTVEINGTRAGLEFDASNENIYVYLSGHQPSIPLPKLDDEGDEISDYSILLDNLPANQTYNVFISFVTSNGVKYNASATITVMGEGGETPEDGNVTINMGNGTYVVGEDSLGITISEGITGNLTVKINGTQAGLDVNGGHIYVYSTGYNSSVELPIQGSTGLEYSIYLDNLTANKTYDVFISFVTSNGVKYNESATITLTGKEEEPPEDGNVTIEIDDDEIVITIPEGISGTLTVKINGTIAYLEVDEDEIDVSTDEGYPYITLPVAGEEVDEYSIYLDDEMNPNTYNVTVTFETDKKTYSKSFIIKIDDSDDEFDIEIDAKDSYLFNKTGNKIDITSDGFDIKDATVKINGTAYSLIRTSYNKGYVDISNLAIGEYEIVVSYGGCVEEEEFEVVSLYWPKSIPYKSTEYVSFNLPGKNEGNLTVTIDGKYIVSTSVVNGFAQVPIQILGVGTHDIYIQYPGENETGEVTDEFEVTPKITYPSQMTVGENKYLIIDVGNATGVVDVDADGESYASVRFTGTVKISLKDLEDDTDPIELFISFNTDDGYYFDDEFEILVKPVPIRLVASNVNVVYTKSATFSVKVYGTNGKLAAKDYVDSIKIGKKLYRNVKTDKNGVAKVSIPKNLAPGKYTITTNYEGKTIKNTLTVKHLLKLNKAKIKKSSKKVVIKATIKKLKGKKVTFKVKGKKVKIKKTVKTNKKGVAKLTIKKKALKKLKKSKKVKYQATYVKDTVKKTVKVKK